jgi:hypothetical protein
MKEITEENIFENKRYTDIIYILGAYKGGLEPRHIAAKLLKKEIWEKEYNNKTRTDTEYYLKNAQKYYTVKTKELSRDIPKRQRINECLKKLEEIKFVTCIYGKYKLNHHLVRAVISAKLDTGNLDVYNKASELLHLQRGLVQFSDSIKMYTSKDFEEEYENNPELQMKIEMIKSKMEELLSEIEEITKETHGVWRRKGYCKFFDLPILPENIIVMYIPSIHQKDKTIETLEYIKFKKLNEALNDS